MFKTSCLDCLQMLVLLPGFQLYLVLYVSALTSLYISASPSDNYWLSELLPTAFFNDFSVLLDTLKRTTTATFPLVHPSPPAAKPHQKSNPSRLLVMRKAWLGD